MLSKIKRPTITAFFLAVILALVSCASSNTHLIATAKGAGSVELKAQTTLKEQEHINTDNKTPQVSENAVVNKNSKVIHVNTDCSSIKNMSDKNKEYISPEDISKYLDDGYRLCSICSKNYSP